MNRHFVLDRSGSMAGRGSSSSPSRASSRRWTGCDPGDRFARHVRRPRRRRHRVDSGQPEARHTAARALRAIEPRGSTDLAGGWLRGASRSRRHLGDGTIDRVLLLTDGLRTSGSTIPPVCRSRRRAACERHRDQHHRGGGGLRRSLLQALADAGGGHFYFAGSSPRSRPPHLRGGRSAGVVARDVVLTMTLPGATVRPLTPHPADTFGGRTEVRLASSWRASSPAACSACASRAAETRRSSTRRSASRPPTGAGRSGLHAPHARVAVRRPRRE